MRALDCDRKRLPKWGTGILPVSNGETPVPHGRISFRKAPGSGFHHGRGHRQIAHAASLLCLPEKTKPTPIVTMVPMSVNQMKDTSCGGFTEVKAPA